MATDLRSFFPRDLFAEFNRLQQELLHSFDPVHNIRGLARGYPALNVGSTSRDIHVYAFAPGLDPASVNVEVEQGLLSISGQREAEGVSEQATRHFSERFAGEFRRVVAIPHDFDTGAVEAQYRDGVLHVCIPRKKEAQPRRISVQ